MSKIIGCEHKNFTTKEGDTIEGTSIYITDKIPPQRGRGLHSRPYFPFQEQAERSVFCSCRRDGDRSLI